MLFNDIEDKNKIIKNIDLSNETEKNFLRIILDRGVDFDDSITIEEYLELKKLLAKCDFKDFIPNFLDLNVLTLAKNKYPSQLDNCAKIILEKIKKSVDFFKNVEDVKYKDKKVETLKMFFQCKKILNKMTAEEISDLLDKKRILSEIDFSDPTAVNFIAIILSKGRGYTTEALTNEISMLFCDHKNYAYHCEIGRLIEKYQINDIKYNLLEEGLLDFAEKNYPTQLTDLAKLMLNRFDFCVNIIEGDINNEVLDTLKNKIKNMKNKCETILKRKE